MAHQAQVAYTRSSPTRRELTAALPAVILFYSFLIPPEVDFYIGPLHIYMYRLCLIAFSPLILIAILKGRLNFKFTDFLVILVSLWFPLSFAMNYDWAVGLESGGSQSLDMLLAYFLARVTLRSFDDLRDLLALILPALLIAGIFLMLESITGSLIIRNNLQLLLGGSGEVGNDLRYELRKGLLRGYSVFIHPIHAGIFLSSFICLYFFLFRDKYKRYSGVILGFLGFFCMSSAAILGIVMNIGLIVYDRIISRIRDVNWPISITFAVVALIGIHVVSENGIISVIYRYLTLDPATGYFRTLIWQYAGAEAFRNPWFGIGYEEYSRPYWIASTSSIDAHYLAMAVKYGMFPAVLYFIISIIVVNSLGYSAARSLSTYSRNCFIGLAISISVIVILMFTVTFWGAINAWFNFMLGAGVAIVSNKKNLTLKSKRER